MVMMLKTTTRWEGFVGAPGYTNFYWGVSDPIQAGVDGAHQKADTFFGNLGNICPSVVTWTTLGAVEVINSLDGKLQSIETATAGNTQRGGVKVGVYSAPSGAVISWQTAGIHRARRVRGRTFIVPLDGGAYDPDGSLSVGTINALKVAAGTLSSAGPTHLVYARPHRTKTIPPVVTNDGDAFAVTGYTVADRTAVLRSRRD